MATEGLRAASAIEKYLYGSRGTHALLSITLAARRVAVVVAPWSHPAEATEAVFEDAELKHVWADPDISAEEIAPPWDIISFDSTEWAGGQWEFAVNCSGVEFCWRSTWPGRIGRCT